MMNSRMATLHTDSPQVSVTIEVESRVVVENEGTVTADGCRYQGSREYVGMETASILTASVPVSRLGYPHRCLVS